MARSGRFLTRVVESEEKCLTPTP